MCQYLLLRFPCGHQALLADSNCYLIYTQLQRINQPRYHGPRDEPAVLPFHMPRACEPGRHNTRVKFTPEPCGRWECRNNAAWGERCGDRDARYGPGSQRLGVGWRR